MAIGPVPAPLMPGFLESFTAQMSGMSAQDAYDEYMTDNYDLGNGDKIGYKNVTTDKPAISGDTSNTISNSSQNVPIDAWHDYVENEVTDVSKQTGGIVDGSSVTTSPVSIMQDLLGNAEAVTPVAIPLDATIVATAQVLGVSIDAAQLDVETKQKFANSIVQSTGMIYDKAKNMVTAWKDAWGNILFPKSVVDAVNNVIEEDGIGETNSRVVQNPFGLVPFSFTYKSEIDYGSSTSRYKISLTPNGAPISVPCVLLSPRNSFAVVAYNQLFYRNSTSAASYSYGGRRVYYLTAETNRVEQGIPEYPGITGDEDKKAWSMIYGTVVPGGGYPEGTSESQAPNYDADDLTIKGTILGANGVSIPVTPINIPDDPYNSTDSTKDPVSPTPDTNTGVKPSPLPVPIPDTNVSNPDVPLTDSSVVNATLINELVEELANTLDPQPGQSSGIIPIPPMPGIQNIDPDTGLPDGTVSFPSIVPASGSGFIHVYNPTPGEFVSFGNWLWVTYADATIDKIWNNPFDGVIGAHELYATPNRDGHDNIRSGFLTCPTSADLVRNRYSEIDCGTIIVPEFYGNYLDYSPYSQAYFYLPFIGINEVSVDDIVGHAVNVRYRIDSYTGSCIAMIFIAKDGYQNLCYQFAGNCAVEVPLAGGSQAAIKAGVLQAEAYARSSLASAALSGAQAIGAGLGTGGIAGGLMGGLSALGGVAGAWYGGKQSVEAARVANKSSVQHSGQFGASHGAMGEKVPFIIIRNPVQVKVVNYNDDYGYPAHKRVIIGGCTGYLRVREVNVISAHATDAEKAAIEAMLKNGVYVS